MSLLHTREARLAVALAIGLLIGTERERRRHEQGAGFAGLRTFTLTALLGGVFAYLDQIALMVAGAVFIALTSLIGYVVNRENPDRGTTTEVALVMTYALGLMAVFSPLPAAALAIVMTWILALRGELHQLVRDTLSERELRDVLIFLLFAVVLMPMTPDRAIGPYGALNPQSLVRLVVLMMTITSAGHVVQRLIGDKLGLAVTGFVGGFVSSSATIAALSMRSRAAPASWRPAVAGALGSSVATVVQYGAIVATIDASLLGAMFPILGLAALAAVLGAGVFARLSLRSPGEAEPPGRAVHLLPAFGFATVFAAVTVAAAALQDRIGRTGIVLVSAAAAFVDAHSTTGSVASLYRTQTIDVGTARLAIVVALSTNTVTKIVLAWSGRQRQYGLYVTLGVLLIAAAAWLGLLIG